MTKSEVAVPSNITKKLQVIWCVTSPPVRAKRWHRWHRRELPGLKNSLSSKDPVRDLESILSSALRLSLDRFTGWEAGFELPPQSQTLLRLGASIYKRGVPFRTDGKDETSLERRGRYDIFLHSPGHAMNRLQYICSRSQNFVVVDSGVLELWPGLRDFTDFVVTARESEKNLRTVSRLQDAWREKPECSHCVIIGGGITGDMAAFAASLQHKPFTLVPTTLLAMADACVGGKTGVNAPPFGKNLLGSFAFPERVLVFPEFLSTLSERDFRSGASECIKHLLLDPEAKDPEAVAKALKNANPGDILPWLPEIINLKTKVVTEDPTENGKRAILNFGHTLAHGLEALSHARVAPEDILLHGEAVAVGMFYALILSKEAGYLHNSGYLSMLSLISDSGILPKPDNLWKRLGSEEPQQLWEHLWPYIRNDKKSEGGKADDSRWVLLSARGKVASPEPGQFTCPVPSQVLEKAFARFVDEYPA